MPLAGLVLNRVHGSGAARLSAERALAAAENLEESRIVDQEAGKAGVRNSPDTDGSSGSPTSDQTVGQLTAGLLRLHAERMRLLSREQRTRDRFTALHPEVAVAEVAALPGDVHDLAGLRDIGARLAAGRPELPESTEE